MKPHVIRLGTAWEPPTAGGASRWTWIRRFGRPSGLQQGDRVLLVWERTAAVHDVPACILNGVALPGIGADASRWEHDVTALLCDRNDLLVDVPRPASACGVVDAHGRVDLPATCGWVALAIVTG